MNLPSFFQKHYAVFTIAFAFFIGYMLGYDEDEASTILRLDRREKEMHLRPTKTIESEPKPSEKNETSLTELLGHVSKDRRLLKQTIQKEYGSFAIDLMNIEKIFKIDKVSKERLIRRLIMKILAAQLNIVNPTEKRSTFTWVTAGDSAAAGHGNFFNQTYTAVMEDTVKQTFRSIGIDFVVKNRGIGGYGSGPELTFCMESIYGSDIDILTWDFGLTDKGSSERILLWANRAGIHPTKPIIMLVDDGESDRWKKLQKFEDIGLSTILMDSVFLNNLIVNKVPDAEDQISNLMPSYLKYLLCNGHIEGNGYCDDMSSNYVCDFEADILCLENKFQTGDVCATTKFHKSWNPGMKYHFLKGRLLGYYILEMLNEALNTMHAMKNPNTYLLKEIHTDDQSMFQSLQSKERNDELSFLQSSPILGEWIGNQKVDTWSEPNPTILFKLHSICHTALLPSEIRYDGMVSISRVHGKFEGGYYMGHSSDNIPLPDGSLPLLYDPLERQGCHLSRIDFKDYFLVPSTHGWLSVTVPNTEEIQKYGKETSTKEGYILICLRQCPDEICPPNFSQFNWNMHIEEYNVEIEVDQEEVIGIKEFEGCYFLEGNKGLKWGDDQKQRYELKFKVNQEELEFQISSIIVF